MPPAPALTGCKLLASGRGRVFSGSRPQSQTPGLALALELPERLPQRPECLAEATVGASVPKSPSRTLPSGRFRAATRPVPGEAGPPAGTLFGTLPRLSPGARAERTTTKQEVQSCFSPFPVSDLKVAPALRGDARSLFLHHHAGEGWGLLRTLLTPVGGPPGTSGTALARPRPVPSPRPVSPCAAARGSGGGCGLGARRL